MSGRGNSHLNQRPELKIKQEREEDSDEEGVDQPDSLYCTENIEEVDGLMEFRRKIESDA